MNKSIKQIIDEFTILDSVEEKYLHILDMGRKLKNMETKYKIEKNKVHGCVSNVWLHYKKQNDLFYFYADSDALIVRGLITIVLKIFSGQKKEDIENINFEKFFIKLGLKDYISHSRSNGIFSLVKKIKLLV